MLLDIHNNLNIVLIITEQTHTESVHTVMVPFPAGLPFFSCRGLVRVLLETI